MLLGDGKVLIPCPMLCGGELQPHLIRLDREAGRRDRLVFTCQGCDQAHARIPTHFAYSARSTACALPIDRTRRKASEVPARVNCPECVAMLVGELHQPIEVDWRPAQAIPEDLYSL